MLVDAAAREIEIVSEVERGRPTVFHTPSVFRAVKFTMGVTDKSQMSGYLPT